MATRPTENKSAAGAQENKTGDESASAPAVESYEQKAERGGHGVVGTFPHPFGDALPDLGEVPEKK
jgi:hypothetical protein